MTARKEWINTAVFIFDNAMKQGFIDHLESLDDLSAIIHRGDAHEMNKYLTAFVNEECNFAGECDDSDEFIILTGLNACLDTTPFWDAINPITGAVELLGYPKDVIYILLGRV